MKVILLQDVPGIGKKWELKEVKGGHGRNYLIARSLATFATPGAIKGANLKGEQEKQKRVMQEDLLLKTLESLKESALIVERKANEKGNLYDSLDVKEISALLTEKLKGEIPVEYIKLEKPLKEVGKHKIAVQKGERKVQFEIEIKPLSDAD